MCETGGREGGRIRCEEGRIRCEEGGIKCEGGRIRCEKDKTRRVSVSMQYSETVRKINTQQAHIIALLDNIM